MVEHTSSVPLRWGTDKYSKEFPEEEGTGICRLRPLVRWLGFVAVEGVVVGGGRLRGVGGGRRGRWRGLGLRRERLLGGGRGCSLFERPI